MSSPSRGSKLIVAFIHGAVTSMIVSAVGWQVTFAVLLIVGGTTTLVLTGRGIERFRQRVDPNSKPGPP